ncbi:MAG: serine/threonine-protein phosphatase [Clostridiales bacterium]|nr:serine/threonine-protein phosphatase [Clostridiales bacterium]
MAIRLLASACSDKGCVRKNNEDSFCLNGHYLKREQMDEGGLFKCTANPYALFAVCDGMGGEEAGEEASLLSVTRCSESLAKGEDLYDRQNLIYFMRSGCEAVYEQARQRGNHSGATMALLVAAPERIRIANMGDSRIYRMHNGELRQISQDHTEIQRLLSQGLITPEQVKTHPKRHMINQYWGMPLERAPFSPYLSMSIPYVAGDRFLLCSDGLTDMLSDYEIASILSVAQPVEAVSEALVNRAKANGGRDNVTVVVVEVAEVDQPVNASEKKQTIQNLYSQRKVLNGVLAGLSALNLYLLIEWIDLLFIR